MKDLQDEEDDLRITSDKNAVEKLEDIFKPDVSFNFKSY